MKEKITAMLNDLANTNNAGDNYDKMAYKQNTNGMAFGGWCLFGLLKSKIRPEMTNGLIDALKNCDTVESAISAAADYMIATMPK